MWLTRLFYQNIFTISITDVKIKVENKNTEQIYVKNILEMSGKNIITNTIETSL